MSNNTNLIPAEKFLLKFWIEDSNDFNFISENTSRDLNFSEEGLFGENLSQEKILEIVKNIIMFEVNNAFKDGNSSLTYSNYSGELQQMSCSFKLFGQNPSIVSTSKLTILLNAEQFPKEEFDKWLSEKNWALKFYEANGFTYKMECSFTKEALIEKFLK